MISAWVATVVEGVSPSCPFVRAIVSLAAASLLRSSAMSVSGGVFDHSIACPVALVSADGKEGSPSLGIVGAPAAFHASIKRKIAASPWVGSRFSLLWKPGLRLASSGLRPLDSSVLGFMGVSKDIGKFQPTGGLASLGQ